MDQALVDEAVRLLKQGAAPDAVTYALVSRGAAPADAQAIVGQLMQLKQQAEASQKVCAYCRTVLANADAYLDPRGNTACRACFANLQAMAAQGRVMNPQPIGTGATALQITHSAARAVTTTQPFRCTLCGCTAEATVMAIGRASYSSRGESWQAEDPERQALAAQMARQEGLERSRGALKLAPCPTCKRRNPSAVSGHWLFAGIAAFGAFALAAGAMAAAVITDRGILAPIALLIAFVGAATLYSARKTWNLAATTVFSNVTPGRLP
jgi:hypothetical protein